MRLSNSPVLAPTCPNYIIIQNRVEDGEKDDTMVSRTCLDWCLHACQLLQCHLLLNLFQQSRPTCCLRPARMFCKLQEALLCSGYIHSNCSPSHTRYHRFFIEKRLKQVNHKEVRVHAHVLSCVYIHDV